MLQESIAHMYALAMTKNTDMLRVHRVCQELRQSGVILLAGFLYAGRRQDTPESESGFHHSRPSKQDESERICVGCFCLHVLRRLAAHVGTHGCTH